MRLSHRFSEALTFAVELHDGQTRRGSGAPYVSHLLAVAAIVLQDGGSEDEAIAGLLHDAVEDQGGQETLDRIRERFGGDVARIVAALTDPGDRPWRESKAAYIRSLEDEPDDVLRVSLADKLSNVRAMVLDFRRQGAPLWERYGERGRDGQLWYFRALQELFSRRRPGPLADEFAHMVGQLERLAT